MNPHVFFRTQDLSCILPAPGFYLATITNARFRTSSRGNRMLHLALHLHGLPSAFQSLADYFVLEGASSQGLSVARRRLVELYHACGFYPEEGDEVLPSNLIDICVEVRVDHVEWENQMRLRILAYRAAAWPAVPDGSNPSEAHREDTPRG
jgi:hypothetical protein